MVKKIILKVLLYVRQAQENLIEWEEMQNRDFKDLFEYKANR